MKIKHYTALLVLYVLSACNNNTIQLNLLSPGIKSGVFYINGRDGKMMYGENVNNGACTIKGIVQKPGFYNVGLSKSNKRTKTEFEIYLEPGSYNMIIDSAHFYRYPQIATTSDFQSEINTYRSMLEGLGFNKVEESDKRDSAKYLLLQNFIKEYPQSRLAAHFMAEQDYEDHPVKYKAMFEQLSPEAKNSDDGKRISENLKKLIRVLPGTRAPQINGKVFDGRTFDQVTAGKKLFLIDFWRSANYYSRTSHDSIMRIYNDYKNKGFTVISVSMDRKPLWWAKAVKDDKLPWPQVSDLMGNDSPNTTNWNLAAIPQYYIVDSKWTMVSSNIPLGSIRLAVSEYFEKHH